MKRMRILCYICIYYMHIAYLSPGCIGLVCVFVSCTEVKRIVLIAVNYLV